MFSIRRKLFQDKDVLYVLKVVRRKNMFCSVHFMMMVKYHIHKKNKKETNRVCGSIIYKTMK